MFPCVCPVIDNEFRHQIAKATVDPQTTMMKFIIRIIVKTAREFGSGEFNWYGGPQVHSECQTTLLILNPTPNS